MSKITSVNKNYALINVTCNDVDKADGYVLTEVENSATTYNTPVNMEETYRMYPTDLTGFICQDALADLDVANKMKG